MFRYQHLLHIFFVFVLTRTGNAQNSRYQLETFGTRNGLLSSKIYTLTQTHDRKLWIGTELGVSSYDGYGFTNYQYTINNESAGRILSITQDSLGAVWIGGDKGLFYFNGQGLNKIELKSGAQVAIESLLTDAGGNVWAGDINGLYKITAAQIQQVKKNNEFAIDLNLFAAFKKRVFDIAADNQQNIYVASFDGVFKLPFNGGTYQLIWTNPDPFRQVTSVTAVTPDSIYWSILDGHFYQLVNEKISQTTSDNFLGWAVFKFRHHVFQLTTSGINSLDNGIQKQIVEFGRITNNAVAALIDEEENIWVGTWEGLQKFRKTAFRQYALQHAVHTEIFSMLEKKNGELLFGSNKGLVFKKDNEDLLPDRNIPLLFSNAEVMCMYEANDGSLWTGSGYEGISRYKNGKVDNWKDTGFVMDNNCEALFLTKDERLLACTENGVSVIDPVAANPMIAHYSFQKTYTRKPELFGCYQNDSSPYWFYGSRGLYRLVNDQLVDDSILKMPVKNLYINKIIQDKKKNIWVATLGKGLLKCRLENNHLVLVGQYDRQDGLPSDNALSVLADKNDDIWWGDYMSFSVLKNTGQHEQLTTFNEKEGLISSYYQSLKLEQQKDGTIWGLTSMGAVCFHPDSIDLNDLAPSLMINAVKASGYKENFAEQKMPAFSYRHNSVQFYFTAVSLSDPGKIRYAYRIKELDSNWNYTTNRSVDFNSLPDGKYTFELKACNNNNVWVNQPLQYFFTVKPPFWQQWWFRIALLLLIAVLIYLLFRRRVKDIRSKAAAKQQLAELEAKAIRAQMNPHFIFNSLNAIQECIVTEKIDAAYDYLSRFSRLLRLVLDHSESNLIRLGSELETIRLYLSLESLRFSRSFTYEIRLDDKLDKDDIYIPSLLLQPFVENAIWHGLINKDGEKKLLLEFTEKEGVLECIIEDNGVGRAKAAEIKQQKLGAGKLESKGTKLALQRIAILNEQKPGSAGIRTIDLFDQDNQPSGTRVIITLSSHLSTITTGSHA